MRGNLGNHGAAKLLNNPNDAVEARYERVRKRMKPARGLLKAWALGLMLACGTAYASEPPSPAPVTMTKNKANHTHSTQNNLVSPDVGDDITDWSIAVLAIIAGLFFSVNFLESRKDDRD